MFAYTLSGDNSENLILYQTENNATMDFLLDGENGSSSRESIANLLDEGLGTSLDGTDDMSCSLQTTGRTDSGVFSGDETPSPPTEGSESGRSGATLNSDASKSGGEGMDTSDPSTIPPPPLTSSGKKQRSKNTSPSRQGPQRCLVCGKVFSNASALTKHKLTHSDERKHACSICGKAFKRQDHLNGHMLTHRNKKPFECRAKGCGKSYCDGRSLRRHIESRHGIDALATLSIQATPPPPGTPGGPPVSSSSSPCSSQGSYQGGQPLSVSCSSSVGSSSSSPSGSAGSSTTSCSMGASGSSNSSSCSSSSINVNVTRVVTNSGKNIICNYVNGLDGGAGSPIAGSSESVPGGGGGDESADMMRDKNKCGSSIKMEVVDIISCPNSGDLRRSSFTEANISTLPISPPPPLPPPPLVPGNEPVIHQDEGKPLDIKLALTPVNVPLEHAPSSSHPCTPSSSLPSATLKLIEPIHFTEAGGKIVGLTLSTANGIPALCSLVSGSKLMGPLGMGSSPGAYLNGGCGTTITTNSLPITIRATQSQLQQLLSQRTPIGNLVSADGVNNTPLVSFTPISFINGKSLGNLPNNPGHVSQIKSEVSGNPGVGVSDENKGSRGASRVDIVGGNNVSASPICVNARGAGRLSSTSVSSNVSSASGTTTVAGLPVKTSPTLLEEQIELIHQIIQQAQEESNLAAAAEAANNSGNPTGKSSKGTSKKSSKATPHAHRGGGDGPVKLDAGEELMKTPCPEKPVECTICCRRFKNTPALNGHMRLHGGYFKKDSDGRKRDIVVANNKESTTTPLQTVSVSVRALIEEKINQKRSSQIQGEKSLDRGSVANNIVAQAVNATILSPSHKGVGESFTGLAGSDGGGSRIATNTDNSVIAQAPNGTATPGSPTAIPDTAHLSGNSEQIVNFGSTFTTSATLNSSGVSGNGEGGTTLQFVCGDENSDYLLMEEEVFNKVSSICPDSFLSGLDESILNSAHDTIPAEWQWAVTSIGVDLGNCRDGNSLFLCADNNSLGEDGSLGGDEGGIVRDGRNVDSSFTSISGGKKAGGLDGGKPSCFTTTSGTGPHSPCLNSQDSPSFIYPTPPASLESHNALQSPLFPFPAVSTSGPLAGPMSSLPASTNLPQQQQQHNSSSTCSIIFSSCLEPSTLPSASPSSLLCENNEMNTNIIIGNSDSPSISDDMDFAQATSDFNQILNDSLCSNPDSVADSNPGDSLQCVNDMLLCSSEEGAGRDGSSCDVVAELLIKVEHGPSSGASDQGEEGGPKEGTGEEEGRRMSKVESCVNTLKNLSMDAKLQSASFGGKQINLLTSSSTDSQSFLNAHTRGGSTPSGRESTTPGLLFPPHLQITPSLEPVQELGINEPSPMNSSCRRDKGRMDIFLSPSRIPPLSPVKRKQVRNTFASNLRPQGGSPPTSPQPQNHFTPYPILSPVRSASGLYWTFASKLGHVEDAKKEIPRINVGSNFQAEIPDCCPPPKKSPRQSCQTQVQLQHDRPLWLPDVVDNTLLDEVENFLEFACCSAIPGGGRNKEYALHVLNHCEGNIMAAMAILMKPNPSLPENMKDYKYEEGEKWTREEMLRFEEGLLKHGKDFPQVAGQIGGGKSVEECVIFYYLWKKVCPLQYERVRDVWKKRDSIFTLELLKNVPPEEEPSVPLLLSGSQTSESAPASTAINTHFFNPPSTLHNNNHHLSNNNNANNPGLFSQQSNTQDSVPGDMLQSPLSPQPQTPEYPCKVCGKIFSKVKSRSAHMKSHRPPEASSQGNGESNNNLSASGGSLSSSGGHNKKSNNNKLNTGGILGGVTSKTLIKLLLNGGKGTCFTETATTMTRIRADGSKSEIAAIPPSASTAATTQTHSQPQTGYCHSDNSLLLSVSPLAGNSPPGRDFLPAATVNVTCITTKPATSTSSESVSPSAASSPSVDNNVPSKDLVQESPSFISSPPSSHPLVDEDSVLHLKDLKADRIMRDRSGPDESEVPVLAQEAVSISSTVNGDNNT